MDPLENSPGWATDIDEIIDHFLRFDGKFEREAVEAAIARKEEITLELLTILEEVADPELAAELADDGDYMAHLYAMFLLAQFRETRAYPLMLRIALLPSDLLESVFGDSITGDFDAVFASVCGGEIAGLQALIENPAADEWVRGAALGALTTLVAVGMRSREEIASYFASLFRGRLTDKSDVVWSELVVYCADIHAVELMPEIEKAYEDGLVDPLYARVEDIREDFAKGEAWALEKLRSSPHRRLIDDTVKEMEGWAAFDPEEQKREREREQAREAAAALETLNPWQPDSYTGFKRSAPKVGRNDPCPCGSGKKYKKCCGG